MGVTLCDPGKWIKKSKDLNPKEGDLIEFDRGKYHHWALYLGEWENKSRMIAHFNPLDMEKVSLGWTDGIVTVENLDAIAGSSKIRVNNLITESPRSISEIRNIVKKLVNKAGPGYKYSLVCNNCENFVTYLRFKITSGFRSQYSGGLLSYFIPTWHIGTNDNGKMQTKQWNANVKAADEGKEPENNFPSWAYM